MKKALEDFNIDCANAGYIQTWDKDDEDLVDELIGGNFGLHRGLRDFYKKVLEAEDIIRFVGRHMTINNLQVRF